MLSLFRNDPFFRPSGDDVFSMAPFSMAPSFGNFGMTPFSNQWDWNTALAQPVTMSLDDMGANYQMTVSAPEFTKDQIKVHVDEGVLTVEGTAQEQQDEKRGDRTLQSYRKSSFRRTMQLPNDVVESQIAATHRDNKLYITFPKAERKESRKAINIQ